MEKAYAIWRAFQDKVLARCAAILLLGCTLLALLEVIRRYVFGVSFEWQQDVVTYCILSGVFLYFSISQRHGSHLNVNLLTGALDAIGPRARYASDVIKVFALVFSFLFLLASVWWGIPEVRDSVNYETRSESLSLPMWPFLSVLLASFVFMAVSLFFQVYRSIQKLRGFDVLEDPPEDSEALH